MNNQTVAIITTNEIAEKIKERLNEFPEELQDVKIVNNKENTNIFYWDYKPFFYAIEDKLKIKDILDKYKNSNTEGYKLLAYGDDGYLDNDGNELGLDLFADYMIEHQFTFIDDIVYDFDPL